MQQTVIEITRVSQVLKLLGDKTRLTIIAILQKRECCVCELLEVFDMSQPSISQHLRKIKDVGLVKEERRGQWIYYSLNPGSEFYTLIEDILRHVPDQSETIEKIEENSPTLRCDC
ncbi:ArsR/SmtB family transcription factor [Bacillus cereus]|uniref:ArsR/SmtB family transcription factor n=1 Tax=Bacillus cereus TaxID=1396 RepID=UPI00124DD004|nr:metalloregulator ArsR/SmtB family transcription factor [Bacillus cereus]KAB2397760.1 winged helix-turn-helix transcriptional regulator [Bacillus cereus]